MQKWKYKIEIIERKDLESKLDEFGESGWELVSADHPHDGSLISFYIFKKPKYRPGNAP